MVRKPYINTLQWHMRLARAELTCIKEAFFCNVPLDYFHNVFLEQLALC
jgi:hypothetical protein